MADIDRDTLKARATELGIEFEERISTKKLAALVREAEVGPDVVAVRVKGPRRGRWRAGRHFTDQVTEFAPGDLTGDELAAFEADPELTVTVLEGGDG